MKIRGAKGLGDACYVYPIAKYFAECRDKVEIMTRFPVVYEKLIDDYKNVSCIDRYAGKADVECRYGDRYPMQDTNMWEDTLINAKLINQKDKIPFKLEYKWNEKFNFETDKKVCLVKTPAYPHSRTDGMTACLLPKMEVWQSIINEFKDQCYFVMSGLKNSLEFKFDGIDLDLSSIDKIPRLMALVDQVDITITPSSHFVSFAEGLDKKLLIGFAQTGISSPLSFYRWSTPAKVITKPNTSDAFIDSEPIKKIFEKFERLLKK